VVGDEKSDGIDRVGEPVFRPDGKVVAFTAKHGTWAFVVVGDEVGKPFDEVWGPRFKPDGKLLAFVRHSTSWVSLASAPKGRRSPTARARAWSFGGR